jgi:hypothetical protein
MASAVYYILYLLQVFAAYNLSLLDNIFYMETIMRDSTLKKTARTICAVAFAVGIATKLDAAELAPQSSTDLATISPEQFCEQFVKAAEPVIAFTAEFKQEDLSGLLTRENCLATVREQRAEQRAAGATATLQP